MAKVQHGNANKNKNSGRGNHPQLGGSNFVDEAARLAFTQISGDQGRQFWQDSDGTTWQADGAGGWKEVAGAGGGFVLFGWRFATSIASGNPGSGRFRMDNATPANVLNLFISSVTNGGLNLDNFFTDVSVGEEIAIQQGDDPTKVIIFEISGPPVNEGGWWTFPVTVIDEAGGLFTNNRLCVFQFHTGGTSGEVNTASNSGAGAGLAQAKSGVDLPFKSLTAGAGVTLTPGADEIEIASDGEPNTASNSGAGAGLAQAKSGDNLPFKSLVAGAGVTLTPSADEIEIAAAGGLAFSTGAAKTAFYTIPFGEIVRVDPSGGGFVVAPTASPSTDDKLGIKNITNSTNSVTFDADTGGKLVDGALSAVLLQPFECQIYQYNGTQWSIVARATVPPVPAVTGSRAGNAALASLLTELESLGFITDSTSA